MSSEMKLHLGCGHRFLPGFIHVDQDKLDHVDHVRDIRDLSIFDDGTIDEIYSCGVIVYFDRIEIAKVLTEWKRVLKKGGRLRVSIADFEKMVQVYFQSGKNLESRGILGPLFGRWEINQGTVIYQKTTYDFKSLKTVLENNGFTQVETYRWQDFLPQGYDDYSRAYIPHKDEAGLHLSLNVICTKEEW